MLTRSHSSPQDNNMSSTADPEFSSSAVIGPNWPGFAGLKYLFIFGASYCDVGYNSESPPPTPENPLGVEFPGFTYAEFKEPNWVGHLATHRRDLLIYDYAEGGSRVREVKQQVESQFLPNAGKQPQWAPWGSRDSLFMTWVGINDAAYNSEHAKNIEILFKVQETLYQAGARNFLLFDIPPLHLSPAPVKATSYINWNNELRNSAAAFSSTHPDASVMIFSSWQTFTSVLTDPEAYGFSEEDTKKGGGPIWIDHIHPTSKVHGVIARDLELFLSAQPAHSGS